VRPRAIIAIAVLAAAVLAVAAALVRLPSDPPPPRPVHPEGLEPETAALIEQASRAVERDPREARAWMELAIVYEAAELWPLAEECYLRGLERRDDLAQPWYHLALVREARGDDPGAIEALRRAAFLRPDFGPAHWRAGFLHLDRGRLDEAEGAFRRGLALDPSDEPARFGLARVLLARDQGAGAAVLLQDLAAGPNREYALLLLDAAQRCSGGATGGPAPAARPPSWPDPWAAEVRYFQRSYGARLRRAVEHLGAGDFGGAISILEPLQRSRPDDPAAVANLAAALRGAGRGDEALVLLERALARLGDHGALGVLLAAVHLDRGDLPAAVRVSEAAWRRHPDLPAAHEMYGLVLLRCGRAEEALVALDRSIELDPRRADAHLGRVMALAALGRGSDAVAALHRARIVAGPGDARLSDLERRLAPLEAR
jgi:tetratricopeptide (TPR) repeat protein